VQHLRGFAPKHCEVIGEGAVAEVVRQGIARAQASGFTLRGPIRLYLELTSMFGSGFATDPLHPWAAGPLTKQAADEMWRAERLHQAVLEYLDEVAGPDNEYSLRALRRLATLDADELLSRPGDLDDRLVAGFRVAYPEKADFAGEARLRELVAGSGEQAARLGIRGDRGRAVIAGVTFALGHEALDDPLFPWVSRTLQDAALGTPDARAARLHERSLAYLKRALSHLEQKRPDVSG
jgi:hypothetical protein